MQYDNMNILEPFRLHKNEFTGTSYRSFFKFLIDNSKMNPKVWLVSNFDIEQKFLEKKNRKKRS